MRLIQAEELNGRMVRKKWAKTSWVSKIKIKSAPEQ